MHKQLAVRDATMVFKCLNGLAPPYLCRSLKPDRKCTTETLGIRSAYIYHSVGWLKVSARLPSEAKSCGIVSKFQSITNLDVFKVKIKAFFKGIFGKLSFRYLAL